MFKMNTTPILPMTFVSSIPLLTLPISNKDSRKHFVNKLSNARIFCI